MRMGLQTENQLLFQKCQINIEKTSKKIYIF